MTEKKEFSSSFSLTDEIADIVRDRILNSCIIIVPLVRMTERSARRSKKIRSLLS